MHRDTLRIFDDLIDRGQKQAAHQLARSRFSTLLFQLSGCKFLLHKLIQLPLVHAISHSSAARPADPSCIGGLMDLIKAYEEHKTTLEYKEAVQLPQEHQESQRRLSHKLWWAQYNYTKGKSLSAQVKDKSFDLFALDATDQE